MLRAARHLALLAALVAGLAAGATVSAADDARRSAPGNWLDADVVRVVDGDTIVVRIGEREERVRYIGVNTPELHHPKRGEEPGGREAARVNRALVEGTRVRLEFDVRHRDRYRRLLAYVWVGEFMVNAELVRRGYAQVMTVPPNVRYQDVFLKEERNAREAGRGRWRGD